MDVKDFVASTILQIMEGVASTQEAARALGGYVNPTASTFVQAGGKHIGVTATGQAIYPIEFDIAVVVSGEGQVEAGGKLQVASIISIGGKGKSTDKQETTSRVKFSVSVTMPVDVDSTKEREERSARASAALRGRAGRFSTGSL
jgi:hypothetical protein